MPNATLTLAALPLPSATYCRDGADGCGKCAACRRDRRKATAETIDADRPYLGPRSFNALFPSKLEPATPWLVDHWSKARQALRAEMLDEANTLGFRHEIPNTLLRGGLK